MNAGFTGLGDLISSHADEEPDDGNDDGDSNGNHLSRASLPLQKADWTNRGKTDIP